MCHDPTFAFVQGAAAPDALGVAKFAVVKSPYLLGNPLGDILAPAMRILVNIGYDDVISPEKLNTVDEMGLLGATYAEENYHAYDRTFYQSTPDEPTPFGWSKNPALTPEEKAAYGEAWKVFKESVKAQSEKPMWGILVKNPATTTDSTPAATRVAANPTASATAAAPPAQSAPVPAAHAGKSANSVATARASIAKGRAAQSNTGGHKASRTAR